MAIGDEKRAETVLGTWFERDRAHVCLSWADEDGDAADTIVEWWDGAVRDAVDEGALDPSDYHASALAFALEAGLLLPGAEPMTVAREKVGFVANHPSLGLYLGWLPGGAPCWSTEADEDRLKAGAYVFTCPEAISENFAEDAERIRASAGEEGATKALAAAGLDGEPDACEVSLGVPDTDNAWPSRVSMDACLAANVIVAGMPAPAP